MRFDNSRSTSNSRPQNQLLNRRRFVKATATGLSMAPFFSLYGCTAGHAQSRTHELKNDPAGILDLAPGLSYKVLDRNGNSMSDGLMSPGRPDGMGCFVAEDGRLILMRNHEINPTHYWSSNGRGAYKLGSAPANAYTKTDLGGVSRLVVNPETLAVDHSNMVLSGTRNNCAGGITPFGWLSCEESIQRIGGEEHGYVFLCDIDAATLQAPKRIDAYGRFKHEAAGFDPGTGRCYLTEDIDTSCLYRFLADDPASPFEGKLQALRVIGEDTMETSLMRTGESKRIDWIDVPDPQAGVDVSKDSQARGAAVFVRGEGCWFDNGLLVFTATEGGPRGKGQIFQLEDKDNGASLTLLAQSDAETDLLHPDNITISPTGDIFLAEDNSENCHIHRLAKDGTFTTIARNHEQGEEIAGLCFSPDGSTLFGNIQQPGITFAIQGF